MGRQGKMANMPFHVEKIKYMYAVEHGHDTTNNRKQVNCDYCNRKNQDCYLWNSGYRVCAYFKCKYINPRLRIKGTCDECKHSVKTYGSIICKKCKKSVKEECAAYCYYYERKREQLNDDSEDGIFIQGFVLKDKEKLSENCKYTRFIDKKWKIVGAMEKIDNCEIIRLIHCMKGSMVQYSADADFIIRRTYNSRMAEGQQINYDQNDKGEKEVLSEDDFIRIVKYICKKKKGKRAE